MIGRRMGTILPLLAFATVGYTGMEGPPIRRLPPMPPREPPPSQEPVPEIASNPLKPLRGVHERRRPIAERKERNRKRKQRRR